MRWPFRRPRDAAPLTEPAPRGVGPTAPQTDAGDAAVAVVERAQASAPRADWARISPIEPTMTPAAPLTFHGDRFGRSVAGARSMAATHRHRPLRPDRAPSGVLLDAVKLESIEPTERRAEPELPPVLPATPSAPPVHRKAVDLGAPARQRLMASDMQVEFLAAPARTAMPEDLTGMSISWSADGGFVSSDRMRVFGARPPGVAESAPDSVEDAEPGTPELRYLPAPGPRLERPPRDVLDVVEQATGVHLGDAIIDRSDDIGDRAAGMGAVAFTEAGTVHLPAELGDINELHNKAIVAHELTHVAQQRSRRHIPAEDSPEGRELEAEAHEMQRRVGGVVRPHFLRRRPGAIDVGAGVQRLATDTDPYAWQERGESPSQQSVLPMFGLSVAAGSNLERRRQHEDEAWAREFEEQHAQHLHELRERRYTEMKHEALRQKANEAARNDEAAPTALNRRETLDLRGQLDNEMPFEYGFPEHLDAYPEPLPAEEEHAEAGHEGEHHDAGHDDTEHLDARHHGTDQHHTTARAHDAMAAGHTAVGARRLATTGTGPGAGRGRTPGGGLGHGRGRTAGGPGAHHGDEGSQYDWQHREPTAHEAVEALFGGGLFGGLLGLAVGADTDETRRAAEASSPQLHERRRDKERELRHRALLTKQNEHRRNDDLDPHTPIKLSHDEIVQIREQVDQEMPLQYVTPEYLDQHEDAQLAADGTFSRAAELATDEHPGTQPGAPSARTDATQPGGAGAGGQAGTDATTDAHEEEADGAGAGGGGGRGGALIRTGLAAAAGAAIGHHLAERHEHHEGHHDAHDDSNALDEESAGRIFAAASEMDIDHLSRRLWSRIRREMRTELLVDRERSGSLADIR